MDTELANDDGLCIGLGLTANHGIRVVCVGFEVMYILPASEQSN